MDKILAILLFLVMVFTLTYGVIYALLAVIWWAFNITSIELYWTYPLGAMAVLMIVNMARSK